MKKPRKNNQEAQVQTPSEQEKINQTQAGDNPSSPKKAKFEFKDDEELWDYAHDKDNDSLDVYGLSDAHLKSFKCLKDAVIKSQEIEYIPDGPDKITTELVTFYDKAKLLSTGSISIEEAEREIFSQKTLDNIKHMIDKEVFKKDEDVEYKKKLKADEFQNKISRKDRVLNYLKELSLNERINILTLFCEYCGAYEGDTSCKCQEEF